MSVLDWFNQAGKSIAGGVSKGIDWISQKISTPVTSLLKKIPIVGGVVSSFDPLGAAIQKTGNAAGQYSRGEKVTNAPTLSDYTKGISSAVQGVQNGISKGASLATDLSTGNYKGAARTIFAN